MSETLQAMRTMQRLSAGNDILEAEMAGRPFEMNEAQRAHFARQEQEADLAAVGRKPGVVYFNPPNAPSEAVRPAANASQVAAQDASSERLEAELAFVNSQGRKVQPYMATANDRVLIAGMEVSVSMATSQGILRPDKEGGYKLTPDGQEVVANHAAKARAAQAEADAPEEHFKAHTELTAETQKALDIIGRVLNSDVQVRVLNELGGTGILSERSRNDLATALGVPQGRAEAIIRGAYEDLSEQATAALVHSRVPMGSLEGMKAWIEASHAKELRSAQIRHFAGGDLSGYRELARKYLAANQDQWEAGFKAATYDPRLKPQVVNGKQVVTLPDGMQVTVLVARRLGLLSA